MVLGMSASVFAASITINSTADTESNADETSYVAYEIFKADINSVGEIDEETGELAEGEEPGLVSYFIPHTTAGDTLKEAIEEATDIFNFTLTADEDRWLVELANASTDAATIADALNTDDIKAAALATYNFAQTEPGGSASADNVDPGYYLITSSLGTELVVQTLADVTINTKNEYIVDDKVAETASVTIGENVTYYIKVYLPATIDTELPVHVHDTLDPELAFNSDSVQCVVVEDDPGNTAAAYAAAGTYADLPNAFVVNAATAPDDSCTFHITLDTEDYAGKYIVFKYTAQLLSTADPDGDGFVNEEYSEYSDYKTVPSNPEVDTYDFDIKKVDGDGNELDGAVFNLFPQVTTESEDPETGDTVESTGQGEEAIEFFEVEGGYRKADNSVETEDDAETVTDLEAGTINIGGFGAGTYYLVETEAPTGFNPLVGPVIITIADDGTITAEYNGTALENVSDLFEIENNAGTQLPSTGGIGTTIFYIVGSILVIGAGVVLITRRRMNVQ
jgi:fimbrial isopeptide formation D2 family protein/LPXTG-motif cell wall-anchored protein